MSSHARIEEEDLTLGQKVRGIFERLGALRTGGHYVLTSIQNDSPYPHHSDVYVDKRELTTWPVEVVDIASAIVDDHREWHKKIDVVVSPAVGGIVLGFSLGLELTTRFGYIDFEDGEAKVARAFAALIQPGSRVLVAEDVTTSGGTVKKVVQEVQKRGGEVKAVVILWQRQPLKFQKIRKIALISKKLPDWRAEDCDLCKEGVRPDTDVGHGAKFIAEFGDDPANWPANRK